MPSSQILGLPKMVQRETKLMYQHELWEHMAMQLQNMSWLVSVIKVSGMIIVGAIVSFTTTIPVDVVQWVQCMSLIRRSIDIYEMFFILYFFFPVFQKNHNK